MNQNVKSKHQDVMIDLPAEAGDRKAVPIITGVLDYFPAAIAEVAKISKMGNDQHNPGQRLHWARGKSTDHVDCIGRHLMQRGTRDSDGARHSAKMAWRALALLQEELEGEQGFKFNKPQGPIKISDLPNAADPPQDFRSTIKRQEFEAASEEWEN
jgi:dATP/dGTP diphosphohydrolase